MRLNCTLIKISIVLLIFNLGASIFLTFFTYNTKIIVYLNNTLLSIVGGAIIMLLTAIVEYLSFKRHPGAPSPAPLFHYILPCGAAGPRLPPEFPLP